MYVEFTHVNNKAIIRRDDTNATEIVPYYDNLKQVLIKENIIELLEDELDRVLENYEYYKDKKYRYLPLMTVLLELFGYFGAPMMFKI